MPSRALYQGAQGASFLGNEGGELAGYSGLPAPCKTGKAANGMRVNNASGV